MAATQSIGALLLVAVGTSTPFVLGGTGYVIHNESRMTAVEQQIEFANEKLDTQGKKVDKIYEILLEDAKRKAHKKG